MPSNVLFAGKKTRRPFGHLRAKNCYRCSAVNELKIINFVLNYLNSLSPTLLTVGSKIFPMLFITGHIPQVPKITTVFLYEYKHDTIALQIHKEPTNP